MTLRYADERQHRLEVGQGQGQGQVRILTTGWAGAIDGWYPQVGRTSIQDDLELLRGCANADNTNVDQLQERRAVTRASLAASSVP